MHQATCVVFLIVVLAPLLAGCGAEPQTEARAPSQERELTEFNQAYRLYLEQNKKPPSWATDLRPYTPGFPLASTVMNDGKYTVLWGANPDLMRDPADTVLAYETAAPASGGWVVMADGSVKQLSAAEFQAARKATKH